MNNLKCHTFLGEDTQKAMDAYLQGASIAQIMPVPENMTLMLLELDEDDNLVYCDSRDTPWPHGLALVNTFHGQEIFAIDLTELAINADAQLRYRHYCKECGAEMKMLMKPLQDVYEATLKCPNCGRHIRLDNDGTELAVEENTNE